MRTRYLYAIALLPLGVWLPSCDNVTSGQLIDEPGNPVLLKILVQDEGPTGGRYLATDLLDQQAPIACSDTEPCPVGDQYTSPSIAGPPCIIPDGQTTGVCPDPLNAMQTPPAIGSAVTFGGNQIRLVFSKVLATDTEDVTKTSTGALKYALHDPSIVGLFDESGAEVATAKYYDPTGSPTVTSDLILEPYGPAIVLKPMDQLAPNAKYVIKLNPAAIKDKTGQAVLKDANGDVKTSYEFTTEHFYAIGGNYGGDVKKNEIVQVAINAFVDPSTVDIKVKDEAGNTIMTEGWADNGNDSTACDDSASLAVNIVRVSAPGVVEKWVPGNYTIEFTAKSLNNASESLTGDAFGMGTFSGGFTVIDEEVDPDKDDPTYLADSYVLPEKCGSAPTDEDMAMDTGDMAGGPDGGTDDM